VGTVVLRHPRPLSGTNSGVQNGEEDPGHSIPRSRELLEASRKFGMALEKGKVLYEARQFDEAEVKFMEVFDYDADNLSAQYFIHQIHERRNIRPGRAFEEMSVFAKLGLVRFKELKLETMSLGELLKTLGPEIQRLSPDKRPITFILHGQLTKSKTSLGDIAIQLPLLSEVTLKEVLDTIVKAAGNRMVYTVSDYAVVFRPKM
jgi:hypothetical protein